MLRKLWNTLRYGDSRTKSFLLWEIGLILATIVFFAAAIVSQSFLPGLIAIVTAIIAAAMVKDVALVVKNGAAAGTATPRKSKKAHESMGDEGIDEAPEDGEDTGGKKKKSKKEKKIRRKPSV